MPEIEFEDDKSSEGELNAKVTDKKKLTNKQKKLNKKKKALALAQANTEHGYMYIGHLPHGFYENELKSYFSQFGKIVRLRLAKSKKTGNYKGYGFIEFADKDVAQIAAETMNNYLMFNRILKCHIIPKEKLNPLTFKNSRKKFFVRLRSMFRKKFNRKRSTEQIKKMKQRQAERMKKREEKLKELGINLDLSKISNKISPDTEESEVKTTSKAKKSAVKEDLSNVQEKKAKKVAIEKKAPVQEKKPTQPTKSSAKEAVATKSKRVKK